MRRTSDRRSVRALRSQRRSDERAVAAVDGSDRAQASASPQRLRRSSRVRVMQQQKRRRLNAEPSGDVDEPMQTCTNSPHQTEDDASSIEPTRKKARIPLADGAASSAAAVSGSVSRALQLHVLQSSFASEDVIGDMNWLTSGVMDLVLWRLAQSYPSVHFLSTDFAYLHINSMNHKQSVKRLRPTAEACIRDLLGRAIDCRIGDRSIVFAVNCELIHWNLLRVQLHPRPELQLFEPMGRLSSRSGISYRSVPRSIVEWLNTAYSYLSTNWLANTVSVITHPHQTSGYDCGVACLLYALKCGQGQTRQEINGGTDQNAITRFRQELQRQFRPKEQASTLSWPLQKHR